MDIAALRILRQSAALFCLFVFFFIYMHFWTGTITLVMNYGFITERKHTSKIHHWHQTAS